MNERDFDKIFRDRLNEPADIPNENQNWQRVAATLGKPQGQLGFKSLLWLPFLLLLLAWNGWQTYRIHTLNTALSAVQQSPFSPTSTVRLYDTIFKTTTVIQRDTIVKYIYLLNKETTSEAKNPHINNLFLDESVPSALGTAIRIPPSVKTDNNEEKMTATNPTKQERSLTNTNDLNTNFTNKTTGIDTTQLVDYHFKTLKNNELDNQNNATNQTTTANTQPLKSETTPFQNTSNAATNQTNTADSTVSKNKNEEKDAVNLTNTTAVKDAIFSKSLTPIQDITAAQDSNLTKKPPLSKYQLDSIEKVVEDNLKARKKAIIKAEKTPIRLDGIGVLAGTAWLMPKAIGFKPSNWIGLTANIALRPQWRLSLSGDYSKADFKVMDLVKPISVKAQGLPQPPTNEYTLYYIEGTQKAWQASTQLHYLFAPNRPFQPHVSLGYTYRVLPIYEIEVEYENKRTGDKKGYDTTAPRHIDHWLSIGAGADYRLNRHISVQGRADYFHEFHNGQGVWVLRGGVFYKF
jgi:hypothetical protein